MMARESWTDERLDDLRAETKREFVAVRTEVRAGFDRVDKKLDRIDERFEKIDERFEKIDERFEKVDERFEKVDERFEHVNAEFVAVRKEMKEGFESQTRMMLYGIVGISASIIAGFGAVCGLVAAAI